MIKIDSNKNIEINRGDSITIKLTNSNGTFNVGDKLKLSIVEKKNYNNVVFQIIKAFRFVIIDNIFTFCVR